jgi:hypothetical protein
MLLAILLLVHSKKKALGNEYTYILMSHEQSHMAYYFSVQCNVNYINNYIYPLRSLLSGNKVKKRTKEVHINVCTSSH